MQTIDKLPQGDCVVVFSAEHCQPCGPVKNMVEMECERVGLACYEIDAEATESLVTRFSVQSLPTTLFLRDGEVITGLEGRFAHKDLVDMLKGAGYD